MIDDTTNDQIRKTIVVAIRRGFPFYLVSSGEYYAATFMCNHEHDRVIILFIFEQDHWELRSRMQGQSTDWTTVQRITTPSDVDRFIAAASEVE